MQANRSQVLLLLHYINYQKYTYCRGSMQHLGSDSEHYTQADTTRSVKEEPVERSDDNPQALRIDTSDVCVKEETMEPELSEILVEVEVPVKQESVLHEEISVTEKNYFHSSQIGYVEVCVTKESCSSPSLDEFVADEGLEPQECKICQKIFDTASHLEAHMHNHDKDKVNKMTSKIFRNDETNTCKTCAKQFGSLSKYLKHRQMHLFEKPFPCEICEKKFASKYLLTNHERIHTGEKPFSCTICEKKFTEKVQLYHHQRTHTGVKRFHCDVCQKSFSLKQTLKDHIRSFHTNQRPFGCEICKKRFAVQNDMKRHQKIHMEQKPYQCDVCRKGYTRKCHLVYHLRSHNNERPFPCKICDRRFLSNADCSKHLNVHMRK